MIESLIVEAHLDGRLADSGMFDYDGWRALGACVLNDRQRPPPESPEVQATPRRPSGDVLARDRRRADHGPRARLRTVVRFRSAVLDQRTPRGVRGDTRRHVGPSDVRPHLFFE